MRKKLLRLLRLAPIALAFWSAASAQTTGTIIGVVTDAATGKPVAGALVVATSPNLQGEQTGMTDESGNYRVTLLPPGQYRLVVQLQGYQPSERHDIRLSADKTLRANMTATPEAVELEEQVVRTGVPPVIDQSSAETGQVMSKEFIANIPTGRSYDAVAALAPAAQIDLYGVAFAGAQSPENAYLLDGLSVSDPSRGVTGIGAFWVGGGVAQSNLLSNFVEEIDVKSGSFMPEYGRATGGVVNVVTKSGSNELRGSVWANYEPNSLVKANGEPFGRAGEAIWGRDKPDEGSYRTDFGFEVGGPIMKDKLWFFAGFAPALRKDVTERFYRANVLDPITGQPIKENGMFVQTRVGQGTLVDTSSAAYQWVGKLTYLVDENNSLTLSSFGAPSTSTILNSLNGAESVRLREVNGATYDLIGRYAGKFADKRLVVEGIAGWHRQVSKDPMKVVNFTDEAGNPVTVDQGATPRIRYRNNPSYTGYQLSQFEALPADCNPVTISGTPYYPCRVDRYLSGGLGYNENNTGDRLAGKASATYLLDALGHHSLKGGVDVERAYYDQDKANGGLASYDYRFSGGSRGFLMTRSYGTVVGNASDDRADVTFLERAGTKSVTQSNGFFAQDSWQVADTGLTVNLGLRWETQSMEDTRSAVSPKLQIDDNIAPRLALIYDFTGQGRGKVAANWGRYYEMIPLTMANRNYGSETLVQVLLRGADGTANCANAFTPSVRPFNPLTNPSCVGVNTGKLTDNFGNPAIWTTIGGVSPVAPDLKGMYVDQFGGSAEYEVFADLSVGVEYLGRRLGRAIEDMSSNDGSSYFIANPGESKPWDYVYPGYTTPTTLNPQVVTARDPVSNRTVLVPFPKPKRDYDGVTFKVQKIFSRNWQAFASYTYSALRGNYAGLFRAENGQLDPNVTSEYDLPTLMGNRQGPLPGDRPHQFKLFGSYTWRAIPGLDVTGGAGLNGRSGTPVNILGTHPIFGPSEVWIVPRGMGGRTPFVTQLDLMAKVEYALTASNKLSLMVSVFNLFNTQEILGYDETWTFDTVQPILGATCRSKNSAGKADPIAAALADCPDLAYLKTTDGRPVTVNQNWGRASSTPSFQSPLTMRVGLQLTF